MAQQREIERAFRAPTPETHWGDIYRRPTLGQYNRLIDERLATLEPEVRADLESTAAKFKKLGYIDDPEAFMRLEVGDWVGQDVGLSRDEAHRMSERVTPGVRERLPSQAKEMAAEAWLPLIRKRAEERAEEEARPYLGVPGAPEEARRVEEPVGERLRRIPEAAAEFFGTPAGGVPFIGEKALLGPETGIQRLTRAAWIWPRILGMPMAAEEMGAGPETREEFLETLPPEARVPIRSWEDLRKTWGALAPIAREEPGRLVPEVAKKAWERAPEAYERRVPLLARMGFIFLEPSEWVQGKAIAMATAVPWNALKLHRTTKALRAADMAADASKLSKAVHQAGMASRQAGQLIKTANRYMKPVAEKHADDFVRNAGRISDLYVRRGTKWRGAIDEFAGAIKRVTKDPLLYLYRKLPFPNVKTPGTLAAQTANDAFDVVATVISGKSPLDAADALMALRSSPDDLARTAPVVLSEAGREATALLRMHQAPERLMEAAGRAVTTGDWAPIAKFLHAATEMLIPAPRLNPVQRGLMAVKGVLVRPWMGMNPAYRVRNWVGAFIHNLADGYAPFERTKDLVKFYETWGYTPPKAMQTITRIGVEVPEVAGKTLKNKLDAVSTYFLRGAQRDEAWWGIRSYTSGLRRTWNTVWPSWKPGVPDDIASGLSMAQRGKLGALLDNGMNPQEIRAGLDKIFGEEAYRLQDLTDLRILDDGWTADQVQDVLGRAKNLDEFDQGLDDVIREFDDYAARAKELSTPLDDVVKRGLPKSEVAAIPAGDLPQAMRLDLKVTANRQARDQARRMVWDSAFEAGKPPDELLANLYGLDTKLNGHALGTRRAVDEMREKALSGEIPWQEYFIFADRRWNEHSGFVVAQYDEMWRWLGGDPNAGPLANLQPVWTVPSRRTVVEPWADADLVGRVANKVGLQLEGKHAANRMRVIDDAIALQAKGEDLAHVLELDAKGRKALLAKYGIPSSKISRWKQLPGAPGQQLYYQALFDDAVRKGVDLPEWATQVEIAAAKVAPAPALAAELETKLAEVAGAPFIGKARIPDDEVQAVVGDLVALGRKKLADGIEPDDVMAYVRCEAEQSARVKDALFEDMEWARRLTGKAEVIPPTAVPEAAPTVARGVIPGELPGMPPVEAAAPGTRLAEAPEAAARGDVLLGRGAEEFRAAEMRAIEEAAPMLPGIDEVISDQAALKAQYAQDYIASLEEVRATLPPQKTVFKFWDYRTGKPRRVRLPSGELVTWEKGITDDVAKSLGYATDEDLIKAIEDAIELDRKIARQRSELRRSLIEPRIKDIEDFLDAQRRAGRHVSQGLQVELEDELARLKTMMGGPVSDMTTLRAEWRRLYHSYAYNQQVGRPKAELAAIVKQMDDVEAKAAKLGLNLDDLKTGVEFDAPMPDITEGTDRTVAALKAELEKVRARAHDEWGEAAAQGTTNRAVVEDWITREVEPAMTTARMLAVKGGEAQRRFTMLDYLDRSNTDSLLGHGYTFPFYQTHTNVNWMRRMARRPAIAAAHDMYYDYLDEINKDMPLGYQNTIPITLPFFGEARMAPQYLLDPMNAMVWTQRELERAETPQQKLQALALGWASPWPGIEQGLAAAGIYEPGDWWQERQLAYWDNFLGPLSRAIRGSTAIMRQLIPGAENVIPAGGVRSEAALWRAAGKLFTGESPETTPFDDPWAPSHVGKAVVALQLSGDITAEESQTALLKQKGDIWEEAKQLAGLYEGGADLNSYFNALRIRKMLPSEMVIFQAEKEYDGAADFKGEEWKAFINDFKLKYPWWFAYKRRYSDEERRESSLQTDAWWRATDEMVTLRTEHDAKRPTGAPPTEGDVEGLIAAYEQRGWLPPEMAAKLRGQIGDITSWDVFNEARDQLNADYPAADIYWSPTRKSQKELDVHTVTSLMRQLTEDEPFYQEYDDFDEYMTAYQAWGKGLRGRAEELWGGEVLKRYAGWADLDGVQRYHRMNDTANDALYAVWRDYYYGPYFGALGEVKATGKRGQLERREIREKFGTPTDDELIAWVNEEYPGRFTEQELEDALEAGVLSIEERRAMTQTPEEQQASEVWDIVNSIPPGKSEEFRDLLGKQGDYLDMWYQSGGNPEAFRKWDLFYWAVQGAAEDMQLEPPTTATLETWAGAQEIKDYYYDASEGARLGIRKALGTPKLGGKHEFKNFSQWVNSLSPDQVDRIHGLLPAEWLETTRAGPVEEAMPATMGELETAEAVDTAEAAGAIPLTGELGKAGAEGEAALAQLREYQDMTPEEREGYWDAHPLLEKYFGDSDSPKSLFWDIYLGQLPPGRITSEIRDDPLIAAAVDRGVRGWLKDEAYTEARTRLAAWIKAHPDVVSIGNPAEWEQVRAITSQYWDLKNAERVDEARALWDANKELLDKYYPPTEYAGRAAGVGRARAPTREEARAAEAKTWDEFAASFTGGADLLELIQSYLLLTPSQRAWFLRSHPDLAEWLMKQDPKWLGQLAASLGASRPTARRGGGYQWRPQTPRWYRSWQGGK